MSENSKRILFLCTQRSVREMMAASLLAAHSHGEWDIWIAPGNFSVEDEAQVRQVLHEEHIPLLSSPQTAEPSFDRFWDVGIVLCSGATNQ